MRTQFSGYKPIKPKQLVAMATSLEKSKNNFIYNHTSTNPVNLVKISLVHVQIIDLTKVVKNKINKKQRQNISLLSAARGLVNYSINLLAKFKTETHERQ